MLFASSPAVPAPHIPGKGLIGGNASVRQQPDKGVNTGPHTGAVPIVVILIHAQKAVVRADIAFQVRVFRPGAVDHDPLGRDVLSPLVAIILRQIELVQVHSLPPPAC